MHRERDAGAAAVEFVMISVLLVLLLFGVLQVGVYFYARNIVAASAADAARYAAASGARRTAGGRRAEQLIADGLGSGEGITCTGAPSIDTHSRLPVTTVRCTGTVKALFAPVNIPLRIDITASALTESTP